MHPHNHKPLASTNARAHCLSLTELCMGTRHQWALSQSSPGAGHGRAARGNKQEAGGRLLMLNVLCFLTVPVHENHSEGRTTKLLLFCCCKQIFRTCLRAAFKAFMNIKKIINQTVNTGPSQVPAAVVHLLSNEHIQN